MQTCNVATFSFFFDPFTNRRGYKHDEQGQPKRECRKFCWRPFNCVAIDQREKKKPMANQARTNADTHKMGPEDLKKYGVEESKRQPGHHPGEVLHQRRSLPYSLKTMTAVGFVVTSAIAYFTLYVKKKPEASAADVAKAAVGVSDPETNRALRPN